MPLSDWNFTIDVIIYLQSLDASHDLISEMVKFDFVQKMTSYLMNSNKIERSFKVTENIRLVRSKGKRR